MNNGPSTDGKSFYDKPADPAEIIRQFRHASQIVFETAMLGILRTLESGHLKFEENRIDMQYTVPGEITDKQIEEIRKVWADVGWSANITRHPSRHHHAAKGVTYIPDSWSIHLVSCPVK